MPSTNDNAVAARFSAACEKSRRHLLAEMEEHGLHAADGWWIAEFVRPVQGGSEVVMRPAHLYRQAPAHLECIVTIEETSAIDANCVTP